MLQNWFQTNVRYEKTLENGTQARVTEAYLVNAMSFTEAESRTIEEMAPFIVGGFEVSAAKKMNISELFYDTADTADRWYRCKLMFVTLDEKTGMEKKAPAVMLVQAADFQSAVRNLEIGMKGTMSDWEIHTIAETNIIDVFGAPSESKAENVADAESELTPDAAEQPQS